MWSLLTLFFKWWFQMQTVQPKRWVSNIDEQGQPPCSWWHFYCIWGCPGSSVKKAMATHSSTLAWKIPWMVEPGGLQSMGSQGVRHDWATSLHFTSGGSEGRICLQCGRPGFSPWVGKTPWRREWQPTPVFLPGEFHGQSSLAGYSLQVAKSRTWLSD